VQIIFEQGNIQNTILIEDRTEQFHTWNAFLCRDIQELQEVTNFKKWSWFLSYPVYSTYKRNRHEEAYQFGF